MNNELTTQKECVEYTISMFASDVYGFSCNDDMTFDELEKTVEKQYFAFKKLAKKVGANFEECMCSWNSGKKLFHKLQ